MAEAGLRGMALTDHDTVDGVEEARAEARRRALAFLTAAELSANEPGSSIHLLSFGFDPADEALLAFMAEYRLDRVRRAREIVNRLRARGVPLRYTDVEGQAGRAAPTRAHVARALVERDLVKGHNEAFRRWLSRGRPAFVEKKPTPPRAVFERVHAAGGVVVLAHPGRTHGVDAIRRWAEEGLDGVEIRHAENPPDVRQALEALAAELDLLRSGGSDWHGPVARRPAPGSEVVPIAWMEAIAARCGVSVYDA